MFVKPWNEEAENILKQLSLSGRAYSKNSGFIREFATKKPIRDLINSDFLDIARNHRKGKSIFVVPPDICVVPKLSEKGINYHFKRFKIF